MKHIYAIILVLFIAAVASAHLSENVAIEQMTREADHVIIGNVQSKASRWEGDQIVTDVEVVVTEILTGKAVQRIKVTYPGGEIGDKGLIVSNVTIPEIGDRLLTFLKDSGGIMSVLYRNHGQFIIDRDTAYRSSIIVGADGSIPQAIFLEDLKNRIAAAQ